METGSSGGGGGIGGGDLGSSSLLDSDMLQNHKASKFRPKGKDWRDWNNEYKNKKKGEFVNHHNDNN